MGVIRHNRAMAKAVDFGNWLADVLRQRRWEQSELWRHGGLTSGQVSRIISGERKAGLSSLLPYSDDASCWIFFHLSLSEFLHI